MKLFVTAVSAMFLLSGCVFNDDNSRELVEGIGDGATPPPPDSPNPSPSPGPTGGNTAFCDSFTGNSTVTTTFSNGCLDCAISDEKNVADDVARTFAAFSVNDAPNPQSGAVRATAQSGTMFTAGRNAGVFITVPRQPGGTQLQVGSSNALTIKTYLAGTLQEQRANTGTPALDVQAVSSDPELPQSYYSFKTTKSFDAVELSISNSQTTINGDGTTSKTPAYKVYELCSDGGVN